MFRLLVTEHVEQLTYASTLKQQMREINSYVRKTKNVSDKMFDTLDIRSMYVRFWLHNTKRSRGRS